MSEGWFGDHDCTLACVGLHLQSAIGAAYTSRRMFLACADGLSRHMGHHFVVGFLWGNICSTREWAEGPSSNNHKVSWDELCLPKCEGGLGIGKLRDASKVFALGLIWRFFSLSESLWVARARIELMGMGSFWDVKESNKDSWLWRKVLKLRPEAFSFMR